MLIKVELKNVPNLEIFKQIKGVSSCKLEGNTLHINCSEDLRERIAEKAAEEQNLILSMQKEYSSLESVFQQLTK
jgi:hypothetical protein